MLHYQETRRFSGRVTGRYDEPELRVPTSANYSSLVEREQWNTRARVFSMLRLLIDCGYTQNVFLFFVSRSLCSLFCLFYPLWGGGYHIASCGGFEREPVQLVISG